MRILFSPIGNTDPWRNNRDGAMLHIVRHYRPDKVVLYFTKSLREGKHSEYKWEEIVKSVCPETVHTEIISEDIASPHDFDAYKETFHGHIAKLREADPEAEILLNITSGTPQMETTLCLEYITDSKNKRVIQVATPTGGSNAGKAHAESGDAEIDLEIVNEEEQKSDTRCSEPDLLFFKEIMLKERLRELLRQYDYKAADSLISGNECKMIHISEEAKDLIRHAMYRSLNDVRAEEIVQKKFNDIYNTLYPTKEKADKKILEHFLTLQIETKQGKISAALLHAKPLAEAAAIRYFQDKHPEVLVKNSHPRKNPMLAECVVKFMNDKEKYSEGYTPGRNGVSLEQLLFAAEYLKDNARKNERSAESDYRNEQKRAAVYKDDVPEKISNCIKKKEKEFDAAKKISDKAVELHRQLLNIWRCLEKRNAAAHQIELIDSKEIDTKALLAAVKALVVQACPDVSGQHCDMYDTLNEKIMELL